MVNSVLRNPRGIFFIVCLGAVAVALFRTPVSAEPPKDARYVGVKKCKACHYKVYKAWEEMRHAKTWDGITGKYKTDPKCIKCHTTGNGEPSGFVSEQKTPRLTGVQCEACHGPGSAHSDAVEADLPEEQFKSLINKVPQNTCVKCHFQHAEHEEYDK